jgi:hypothetical protein
MSNNPGIPAQNRPAKLGQNIFLNGFKRLPAVSSVCPVVESKPRWLEPFTS